MSEQKWIDIDKHNARVDLINSCVKFHVTGRYNNSGRFPRMTFKSHMWANGINLWRGSVWGVLPNGKRILLKRVWN